MKLILVVCAFFMYSNSLSSQDIANIKFIYGIEGTSLPISASCEPNNFMSCFGDDLNFLTTYSDLFIEKFQKRYQELSPIDSTGIIDPRIMAIISYKEEIPNDTIYLGEYFGIYKNKQFMQNDTLLLNLIKTKIGWTYYTENTEIADSIIKLLSAYDDEFIKSFVSHINRTFTSSLKEMLVVQANLSVEQRKLLDNINSYINGLSDTEKTKFYEVFFRILYGYIKPESSSMEYVVD